MKLYRKERDRREEEQTEKDTKGPGNLWDLRHMMNSNQIMVFSDISPTSTCWELNHITE